MNDGPLVRRDRRTRRHLGGAGQSMSSMPISSQVHVCTVTLHVLGQRHIRNITNEQIWLRMRIVGRHPRWLVILPYLEILWVAQCLVPQVSTTVPHQREDNPDDGAYDRKNGYGYYGW